MGILWAHTGTTGCIGLIDIDEHLTMCIAIYVGQFLSSLYLTHHP